MSVKYFIDANSAAGYVNLQKENLTGISKIYHLKSPSDKLVHNLLEKLSLTLAQRCLTPEFVYSTFNPDFLSGLVIRELGIAFLSGEVVTATAQVTCLMPVYDRLKIEGKNDKIRRKVTEMNQFYKKMYMHFNGALHIHDEWEKIYIDRMDYEKADRFRKDLVVQLFDTKIPVSGLKSQLVHRFFGTSTPDGLQDFIPELTAGLKRYFIKGRPGTGKSTLMKDVVKKAELLGYDADVYHCALDPKSVDMVIVPELSFCLFDATAPHEYDAVFTNDEIIDTYSEFIKKGTDERCAAILKEIETKYKRQIKMALEAMRSGHERRAIINEIYSDALIPERFADMLDKLVSKL